MKVAIMQPYFFPYIGYFQLIQSVDTFIIYDNIQYTKKGWINRNRILTMGEPSHISLTLKKDSDYLDVKDRYLADIWKEEKMKMLNKIRSSYSKAPYFKEVYPIIESCILYEDSNLFNFILNSVKTICEYLDIKTSIEISSTINIDHALKGKEKVIALCKEFNADKYINAIGGVDLYDKNEFKNIGLDLSFIKADSIIYKQYSENFIPYLSIIDVMMFNSKEEVKNMLTKYTLV
jgi:hypothetical protein